MGIDAAVSVCCGVSAPVLMLGVAARAFAVGGGEILAPAKEKQAQLCRWSREAAHLARGVLRGSNGRCRGHGGREQKLVVVEGFIVWDPFSTFGSRSGNLRVKRGW